MSNSFFDLNGPTIIVHHFFITEGGVYGLYSFLQAIILVLLFNIFDMRVDGVGRLIFPFSAHRGSKHVNRLYLLDLPHYF